MAHKLKKKERRQKARQASATWLRPALAALGIFVLALVTRLAFLAATPDRAWPHATLYEGDAPLWAFYAVSLEKGRPFEHGLPIHTPGMGYLLAALWSGDPRDGFLGPKILFCVLGSVTCVLTWHVARRLHGGRIGFIAGLLSAASFGLTVQCVSLNNETPYTLLLMLVLWLTLRSARAPTLPNVAGLALLNGLAVLFRAEHSALFLLLLGYVAWAWLARGARATDERAPSTDRRKAHLRIKPLPALAVLVVGYFLVPLPWNIRSAIAISRVNTVAPREVPFDALEPEWSPEARALVRELPAFAREACALRISERAQQQDLEQVGPEYVRRFFAEVVRHTPEPLSPLVFVSNQGAFSFALANNELATGGFSTRLLDPEKPVSLDFSDPRHLRLYQRGFAVGMQWIADHPGDALRLAGEKLRIFAAGLAQGFTPWNVPLGIEGVRRPVDQLTPGPGEARLWTALILMLGMGGLFVCAWRQTGAIWLLVLAYKIAIVVAFYGYARQAVSILPVFYVLIALGVDVLVLGPVTSRWPRGTRWEPGVAAALAVGLAIAALAGGMRDLRYDVAGPRQEAPILGRGAFESHHLLEIRAAESE